MTNCQFLETLVDRKQKNIKKKKKKKLKKFSKKKDFKIIMQSKNSTIDYLEVTLNLNDGIYHLSHKPNEDTTYMNVKSDHPPQITRKIN